MAVKGEVLMPRATIFLKKCPGCTQPVKLYRLTSTDTSMAKFWTDGKMEAPLIPDQPEFVKCPFCKRLFWVEEAETLAEEEQKLFKPDRWKEARFARIPGHEELFDAVESGCGDTTEHEIYLRMRLWWLANEADRKSGRTSSQKIIDFLFKPPRREKNRLDAVKKDSRDMENMTRLFALLEDLRPDVRIIKAELAREMGQFEKAKKLLQGDFPPAYAGHVSLLQRLIAEGDTRVRRIKAR